MQINNGFVAGTLMHTKDGLKPIEQIKVGDLLLSKHESRKGEREYKRVSKTFVHEDRQMILLSVGGMQAGGVWYVHRFAVTPEHPFWVQGKGWKEANSLKPSVMTPTNLEILAKENPPVAFNARLFVTDSPDIAWMPTFKDLGMSGLHLDVRKMEMDTEKEEILGFESVRKTNRVKPEHLYKASVCNIEIEDFHTYYVGEVGVWVHNKNT